MREHEPMTWDQCRAAVGQRLQGATLAEGITYTELGRRIGQPSLSKLSALWRGENLNLRWVLLIGQALNLDFNDLFEDVCPPLGSGWGE